jgi:chromosome segregation ATPase
MTDDPGIRRRLTRQGEDALGRMAHELLENPLVTSAFSRAFEAREKAVQAQELALGALNLPSAADLERLTRRIRSVSQRLEGIEDAVDRLEERIEAAGSSSAIDARLGRLEALLDVIAGQLAAVREAVDGGAEPVPRGQERIRVEDASG